jgi:hypothetical protein
VTVPLPPLELSELLSRLSQHLDTLSGEVHAVEHGLGAELGRDVHRPTRTITQLQSLDYLRQSLEDLALLAHVLGSEQSRAGPRPPDLSAAARRLRLQSTRALLQPDQAVPAPFAERQGEVDLF